MGDTILVVYLSIAAIVFCVSMVTLEAPYGRGTTGETDIGSSLFYAALWPVILAALIGAWTYSKFTERSG